MKNRIRPMMNDLREFVDQYNSYVHQTLTPMNDRLTTILETWRTPGYWQKLINRDGEPVPTPVQRVRVRIKQSGAVVRKVIAKPNRYPDGFQRASFQSMTDAIGARVVVYFLSSLPLIDREIRNCGCFDVSEENPPHAYVNESMREIPGLKMEYCRKASGYCSVHYTLRLRDEFQDGTNWPWFELQLRTLTQDVWAEIEHLLGYKYRTSTPALQAQLRMIGRMLCTIDEYFDYLRDGRSESEELPLPAKEELLTPDTLPRILALHGLSCSQYDLEGLLKMAAGCGIKTVGALNAVLTPDSIEHVSAVAKKVLGRPVVGSELMPLLLLFEQMDGKESEALLAQWSEFVKLFKATKI